MRIDAAKIAKYIETLHVRGNKGFGLFPTDVIPVSFADQPIVRPETKVEKCITSE